MMHKRGKTVIGIIIGIMQNAGLSGYGNIKDNRFFNLNLIYRYKLLQKSCIRLQFYVKCR
jgi:hypothetical protein